MWKVWWQCKEIGFFKPSLLDQNAYDSLGKGGFEENLGQTAFCLVYSTPYLSDSKARQDQHLQNEKAELMFVRPQIITLRPIAAHVPFCFPIPTSSKTIQRFTYSNSFSNTRLLPADESFPLLKLDQSLFCAYTDLGEALGRVTRRATKRHPWGKDAGCLDFSLPHRENCTNSNVTSEPTNRNREQAQLIGPQLLPA